MFILKSVYIEGFWNDRIVETRFLNDVNIFIGTNGTGKTTFINLLQSMLTVDITMICNLQFSSATFELYNKNQTRKISIHRVNSDPNFLKIEYRISNKKYVFPIIYREMDYRRRRLQPQYIEEIKQCKNEISKLISVSWLSVHRELYNDKFEESLNTFRNEINLKPPIDLRIDALVRGLTKYQLKLVSQANELSTKFQKEVLSGMLYNEKFDKFSFNKVKDIDIENIKDGLCHAYKDLGALDKRVENLIEVHSAKIKESVLNIKEANTKKKPTSLDDIIPIILFNRTEYIIKLSSELEKTNNELFSQLHLYKQILEEFMEGKTFDLNKSKTGEPIVKKGKKIIPIEELSSGEKQLFVLLTETLLQNNKNFLFIADEPELSLHIGWQKKLLGAIKKLNSNSQIIVATHSPEIAAEWNHNIIDMADVIHDK